MRTFANIDQKHSDYENSEILLVPVPYDGTSSWGKGADKGFEAFLEAAENMELYDIETDSQVWKKGIHILPAVTENSSPEKVFETVHAKTAELLNSGRFITFFGGEHSVSIGIIKAFVEKYPDITILHFDAHADLRPEYNGSRYNHACAVHEASVSANLVQAGIRSMDVSEKEFLNRDKCFFAADIHSDPEWEEKILNQIGNRVYITFDLDAFDPSIMPSTGTPEPGGLFWDETVNFLSKVFRHKNVLGFDIVELAPVEGLKHPDFLAAKLYYKMLSYKFRGEK
jgi:agmatinase